MGFYVLYESEIWISSFHQAQTEYVPKVQFISTIGSIKKREKKKRCRNRNIGLRMTETYITLRLRGGVRE